MYEYAVPVESSMTQRDAVGQDTCSPSPRAVVNLVPRQPWPSNTLAWRPAAAMDGAPLRRELEATLTITPPATGSSASSRRAAQAQRR